MSKAKERLRALLSYVRSDRALIDMMAVVGFLVFIKETARLFGWKP